ncbi:sodium-dependent phosphate transport protein 1: chloroplastic-like protein [Dinothrombium tinctorium]|uniref:Sodium-dependent phosphate transport protein 1: chloroplastic-like protein n=1 Tax=Dinothrombium tinctorium TaxID=1965070 RepID=A0A3S3QK40_9ACAR|nr:sodium-dependent phosphate transport protein 1: chloroplastic-like protein [Dinothrombium tinctorium]RWS10001.1 sodium-dependent phosphate transport protein 1: chloroplastic-like protein [Dinothrombium tinctorium]
MKRETRMKVALCSTANFINSADRILMPIAVIAMSETYSWDLNSQGWVLSSFAFGYITSQIFGTHITNRMGSKLVLTAAVFLWSFSTLITPYIASQLYLLIAFRILLGLGEGLGLPTIFKIFAHSIPVEERSTAFGYLIGAGTIGQTIAALTCPHLPWELTFYFFGTLGILWVLIWIVLYKDENDYVKDELPVTYSKTHPKNVPWTFFISRWPFWAIYIAHFAMNWSNYIVMQWLPTYLTRNLEVNKSDISVTAVPYIVNSLFGVVSGHFADYLISRKWTILSVRRLMTAIGLFGPGIFLICFCAVNKLFYAIIFVSISMALCACNSAGHLSNHADVAPNHAGITFAVSNTIATIPGILCGPLTASLVIQSHGRWFPVFVLAAALNFVGTVIYASQSSASQLL